MVIQICIVYISCAVMWQNPTCLHVYLVSLEKMKYVKAEENGYSDLHGVHLLSGKDKMCKPLYQIYIQA